MVRNQDETFQKQLAQVSQLPTSWDWVAKGKVGPIKDQGQCGSCYAYATLCPMESLHAIKTGILLNLSEQQIVDCSAAYQNLGCNGGWYYWSWSYLAQS